MLPKRFADATHFLVRPDYPGIPQIPLHSSYRPNTQGDPLSRKLYVACKTCNTGWMGKLQEAAKPNVRPLLLGDWSILTPETQDVVAAWAAMTAMVIEFADRTSVAIPQSDRAYFMANKRPPAERWQIWMGRYRGIQDRSFLHTMFFRLIENVAPNVPDHPKGCVTTIRIGELLLTLLVIPSGITVRVDPAFLISSGIGPIWPPNGNVTRPIGTIDDNGADRIHGFIRGIFDY